MKETYSCFSKTLLLVLFLCSVCASTFAASYDFSAVNDDGVTIYYNRINNGKEAEVTYEDIKGDSYSKAVNIPETITNDGTTLKVTSIGEQAFYSCTKLTSVTIPNTVKSFGKYSFYNCSKLTSFTIPNSVTTIGYGAFNGCTGLTSIVIPNSVKAIGDVAFKRCTKLASVTIPNSITSIGVYVFCECSSLTSIDIPNTVKTIGVHAFSWCTSLTTITIPNSVTSIGNKAFYNCTNLTSVTISSSVNSIGEQVFSFCNQLTKMILLGTTLPKCDSTAFKASSQASATLYCKSSLAESCNNTEPWKNFGAIKSFPYITLSDVGIATGCFDSDLDFTSLGLNAYIASGYSPYKGKVLLTRIEEVPAGTGFIVMGSAGTYEIPATATDYAYANMLVGVLAATTLQTTDGNYTNYVLGKGTDGFAGFFIVPKKGTNVPTNKAYLQMPTSIIGGTSNAKTSLSLSFDDEDNTTGISAIKEKSYRTSGKTVIYNLNGQRKQSLTKGLNIVNGKKIFIK